MKNKIKLKMLTEKQMKTFQLIVSLRNQRKYPSLEKLGIMFGISRHSVNDRVNALVEKEYIIKDEHGACIPTINGIEQYMQDVMSGRFKRK